MNFRNPAVDAPKSHLVGWGMTTPCSGLTICSPTLQLWSCPWRHITCRRPCPGYCCRCHGDVVQSPPTTTRKAVQHRRMTLRRPRRSRRESVAGAARAPPPATTHCRTIHIRSRRRRDLTGSRETGAVRRQQSADTWTGRHRRLTVQQYNTDRAINRRILTTIALGICLTKRFLL